MTTTTTIIATTAPTPAFPAVAWLYHANGKPVLDQHNSCIFGTGSTVEEAIEALNRIHPPRAGEVRAVRA
jgi:hypothetical protein